MATTSPWALRASTSASFWCGLMRANTLICRTLPVSMSGDIRAISSPVTTWFRFLLVLGMLAGGLGCKPKIGEDCATSVDFARRLMSDVGVATVPGEAFGAPGFVRMSYALAPDRIRAGVDRLARLLGARNT